MKYLDIAEVAHRTGVPASALRFYEEKGLIAPVGRRGLRRLFDIDVLERLSLIALGRTAGFSLEEIAQMFRPAGRLNIRREKLSAKADDWTVPFCTLRRCATACAMPRNAPHQATWNAPPSGGWCGSRVHDDQPRRKHVRNAARAAKNESVF
jgi:DNA-binding transcriptional MerR regulator